MDDISFMVVLLFAKARFNEDRGKHACCGCAGS
jgi:hypothetical protein